MTTNRPDMGFGNALGNLADFAPKSQKSLKANTKQAAAAAGFTSREASQTRQRRRRTGRDTQLNLKVRAETKDIFCAIADENNWGLGETFEKAVALLRQENGNL